MEKYESPLGLPDEYYRLIGIIAAHWERLDFILGIAVAELGTHDHLDVALLIENIGFNSKIDLIMVHLRNAFEGYDDEVFLALKSPLEGVKTAYGLRNKYVHARWIKPPKEGDLPLRSVLRTKNGKLSLGNEPTGTAELVKAAQDIENATGALINTYQRFNLLKFEDVKRAASP